MKIGLSFFLLSHYLLFSYLPQPHTLKHFLHSLHYHFHLTSQRTTISIQCLFFLIFRPSYLYTYTSPPEFWTVTSLIEQRGRWRQSVAGLLKTHWLTKNAPSLNNVLRGEREGCCCRRERRKRTEWKEQHLLWKWIFMVLSTPISTEKPTVKQLSISYSQLVSSSNYMLLLWPIHRDVGSCTIGCNKGSWLYLHW